MEKEEKQQLKVVLIKVWQSIWKSELEISLYQCTTDGSNRLSVFFGIPKLDMFWRKTKEMEVYREFVDEGGHTSFVKKKKKRRN